MRSKQASQVNRRRRSTKAEIDHFRESLYAIVDENRPCSVRQVYYLGLGHLWEKDTGSSRRNYGRVVENLGVMREEGLLPFEWISDSTRYRRIPTMFGSVQAAVERHAETYRRDLWAQQPRHIEVWAESDSITGVIDPVTRALGVGLFSCRGQTSKTFAHSAAAEYLNVEKPVTVLYVGDWDPSGLSIANSLRERLGRYSRGEVEIDFTRLAVSPYDVRTGRYISHSVNANDKNMKRFEVECKRYRLDPSIAVEVEAIPPPELRGRLEDELYDLAEDIETWNATIAAEESEKEIWQLLKRSLDEPA